MIHPKQDPTERYIHENEYVHSLPVRIINGKKIIYKNKSIFWLIKSKLSNLKDGLFFYIKELLVGYRDLVQTYRLKGNCKTKYALVIGNGPTQGYLTQELLQEIKDHEIEVFAINFWNENEQLSKVVPDYFVISDPLTLKMGLSDDFLYQKNKALLTYLTKSPQIQIFCPVRRCKELRELFGKERIHGFADAQLEYWTKNISPIFPRGYVGMTLYKSLAIAKWLGYEKIFVIGMDNTYPRNIYCDKDNRILNHEIHAKTSDFLADMTFIYPSIGDLLVVLSNLFYDAYLFRGGVINLDPYSLTDAFEKIDAPLSSIDNLMKMIYK